MRRRVLCALLLASCAFAAAGCNEDDSPGPRIDRVSPPQSKIGEVIYILGERFCGPVLRDSPEPFDAGPIPPDAASGCATGFVTFGPIEGSRADDVQSWTDTMITVRVPQIGPGPTGIVVTVNGRQSAVADFEVIE